MPLKLADLRVDLEAVFCYDLIKTIYRSKCTCTEIATFLLGYRLLLLYCGRLSGYKTFKAFFSNSHSSVIHRLRIHCISEAAFSFCAFLLYTVTRGLQPLEQAQSDAALLRAEWGGGGADGMMHLESEPLVRLFEEIT